jgi:hypothetical protein
LQTAWIGQAMTRSLKENRIQIFKNGFPLASLLFLIFKGLFVSGYPQIYCTFSISRLLGFVNPQASLTIKLL